MKSFFLIGVFGVTFFSAQAQYIKKGGLTQRNCEISEHLKVSDSVGASLAFEKWQPPAASGKYMPWLVDFNKKDDRFMLLKTGSYPKGLDRSLVMVPNVPPVTPIAFYLSKLGTVPFDIDTAIKKSLQEAANKLNVGNQMPLFVSTDIDGNKINLEKLKGKIVVFDFWFIGCPPCRYLIPQLDKIAHTYKANKDIVFIAISNDKAEALREFLKKEVFKYQMIGNGQWLFDYFQIESCPLSLVIDRAGKIVFNSKEFGVASIPDRIKETLEKVK